jgi:hypothetical protein
MKGALPQSQRCHGQPMQQPLAMSVGAAANKTGHVRTGKQETPCLPNSDDAHVHCHIGNSHAQLTLLMLHTLNCLSHSIHPSSWPTGADTTRPTLWLGPASNLDAVKTPIAQCPPPPCFHPPAYSNQQQHKSPHSNNGNNPTHPTTLTLLTSTFTRPTTTDKQLPPPVHLKG